MSNESLLGRITGAGWFCAVLLLTTFVSTARAENKCKLMPVGELPITMSGLRPLITAQINGKDAQFVLDSGAFFSVMSVATAAEFNLKLSPFGLKMVGIGGVSGTSITAVEDLKMMGLNFRNAEFLVGGSEVGAAGVIGQNLFSHFDVEYDLARGVVRLFRSEDCEKQFLAYWVAHGQAYSAMEINKLERGSPHTIGVAYLNGKKIRAMFDTGAPISALTQKAAEHAGVKINSPGVTPYGYARGFGRGMVKQYLAVFPSFQIGDGEEVKNTRLLIADFEMKDADMLVGADFFLSHHVFVSNSQRKLYLTYNGGPVFNLTGASAESNAVADQMEAQKPDGPDANPVDAAVYARRGAASIARRDFQHGIADLSKAIDLDANDSEFFYQRAVGYGQTGQAEQALADLDRALSLKTDFQQAHSDRAEIYLALQKTPEALADLDALDRSAAPQADLRLGLARQYERADAFAPAIAQYDLWIQNHPLDSRFVGALASRCLTRALQNEDLTAGLADCDRASKLVNMRMPDNAPVFSNRGMVRLRQGEYAKALDDFNDALKLQPKNALALYGRGVAKSLKDKGNAGQADIDAANALAPKLAERYQHYGIAP
jgi:tetratricopeptide (TPR) repeat protein